MRRLSYVVGTLALAGLAGLIAACSEPTSRSPTTPSPPGVLSMVIIGPSTIAPGQSAQFTVEIRMADGTTKIPSPGTAVQWSTSGPLLQVNAAGLATVGQLRGDVTITAAVGTGNNRRQATKEVVILPSGTFRMVGFVSEAGFSTVPVASARVEVTPGSLVATTSFDGTYRLYGVPPDANVQVTKSGYFPFTQAIQLTAHSTRNFPLALSGTRLSLAGPYTLTMDLAGVCSSSRPLPVALQRRTYDAVLTQNGASAEVVLTEPRFRLNSLGQGNRFSGRVDSTGATFALPSFDAYYYPYYGSTYPSIAERLADGTILVAQGTAVTTGSAAGLSGNMDAGFYNWDSRFPASNSTVLGFCVSQAARFTLTPR